MEFTMASFIECDCYLLGNVSFDIFISARSNEHFLSPEGLSTNSNAI